MKNKVILITTVLFFLVVNTTFYWEGVLGLWAVPVFMFLAVVYIVLCIVLISQLFVSIKEKFSNKSRLIILGLLTFVLALTFYKPFGIIDFDNLGGKNLLTAQREGAANCMTTFNFKDDFTFREINVCFGVSEVIGKYRILNDTIFLENVNRGKQEDIIYKFGVIEEQELFSENKFVLKLFENHKDTIGYWCFITHNELNINPILKLEPK